MCALVSANSRQVGESYKRVPQTAHGKPASIVGDLEGEFGLAPGVAHVVGYKDLPLPMDWLQHNKVIRYTTRVNPSQLSYQVRGLVAKVTRFWGWSSLSDRVRGHNGGVDGGGVDRGEALRLVVSQRCKRFCRDGAALKVSDLSIFFFL